MNLNNKLGQQDILNLLEDVGVASAEELSEVLEVSLDAVRTCLRRLLKSNEVEKVKLSKKEVEAKGIKYSGRHFLWKLKIE